MLNIKPISDLRYYTEVLKEVTVGNPVYLTRNGRGEFAIVRIEDLERLYHAKSEESGEKDCSHCKSGEGMLL